MVQKKPNPSKLKTSIHAKEFLGLYLAFKKHQHLFCGSPETEIITTDSKSVTAFLQSKMIPTASKTACGFVL